MKQLFVFIRKEFYHVFRDKRTLIIMFGMPLIQVLLFGYALTSEVRNAEIAIIDNSKDISTQQIINKLKATPYFIVHEKQITYLELESEFKKGNIKAAVIFPENFDKDFIATNKAQIQVIADGSEPNIAKTIINYITSIIQDYRQQINAAKSVPAAIIPEVRMFYNEEGNGSIQYVPGVLALILMLVCTALTSVAVVREKEMGTMEILLVSPFKPVFVLIAKATPYLILSLVNFTFILVVSVFILNVPILGNILLLYFVTMLFILASLSFGLLISNITKTQQQALTVSFLGMMLPTIILTGFIFPLENMPKVFQIISNIFPAKWYFLTVKSIMLKGLGFSYVWKESLVLTFMILFLLTITIKKFNKRLS